MTVRLGQCAYSALITMGLVETATLVFLKRASVRDFMVSAIADAKTTGLPYSSESSSCSLVLNSCHLHPPPLSQKNKAINNKDLNEKDREANDLKSAARIEGGGIVNHLEDERAASAHLDLADVEAEAKECFEEGALAVGLSSEDDDLRYRELLAEGNRGGLEPIVGLEAGLGRR